MLSTNIYVNVIDYKINKELHQNKKNLAKALLAYALDQGVKYIKEHDLSEHIDKLKKWLNLDTEQTANNQQDTGSDEA